MFGYEDELRIENFKLKVKLEGLLDACQPYLSRKKGTARRHCRDLNYHYERCRNQLDGDKS